MKIQTKGTSQKIRGSQIFRKIMIFEKNQDIRKKRPHIRNPGCIFVVMSISSLVVILISTFNIILNAHIHSYVNAHVQNHVKAHTQNNVNAHMRSHTDRDIHNHITMPIITPGAPPPPHLR